jgi:hypothetical protein
MKIRTTLLLGAGAASGLALVAATPAGAAPTGPPAALSECTGTAYGFDGQLTSGPDFGSVALEGQLCVGDNHGNSPESPVTGSVRIVPLLQDRIEAAVRAAPGIPVRGVAVGQNIRIDGRTTLQLTRAADAAALGVTGPVRRVDVFVRAAGSQVTAQQADTTLRRAPAYRGTFDGPHLQDQGTFVACSDCFAAPS